MSAVVDAPSATTTARSAGIDAALAGRGPVASAIADALPIVVGYLPFGLVLGARLATSTIPALAGWSTSPLVFAGAAQLAMVELIDADATLVVVVLTALVINARLVVYSGALGPLLDGVGQRARLAIAAVLTDPLYALASTRLGRWSTGADRQRYLLAAGATLWVGWMTLTAIGMVAGGRLPDHLPLDMAVPLTFLGLLVPTLTDRATLASAIVAGTVAVLARGVPLHLGLLVGTAAGIAAGTIIASRRTP